MSNKAVSPTSAEVKAHLLAAARKHPGLVRVRSVIRSGEGRPIYAATVTNRRVPDADKQNVLVVGGQHGNEESGRIVALALIDWLLTKAAAATVRRQKIVIMPNVNPDGAEQDLHKTPAGIRPNRDHAPEGPATPEGMAVEKVARSLQPEVFVDLHARGYTGYSYDMVLHPYARPYTEDSNLLHQIAAEMSAAGEKLGIPHMTHPLTWPGWGGTSLDEPSTTVYAYRNFKSLVFLTENCESNECGFSAGLRGRVGVARLKALLAWGNRRHPKLCHAGYPCMLVCGMFLSGVVAVGKTAAQRRRSRIAAWRNVAEFRNISTRAPVQSDVKEIEVDYAGERLPAVGFQFQVAGRRRPQSVRLNGRKLCASETRGYTSWHDGCSTFVVVAVRGLEKGKHQIVLEF